MDAIKNRPVLYESRDVFYEKIVTCQWTVVKHLVTNFYYNVSNKNKQKNTNLAGRQIPCIKYVLFDEKK